MARQADAEGKLREMAARIREMREIVGYSVGQMAEFTGVPVEEYRKVEAAQADPTFNFLHQCAIVFGVDINSLLEGHSAHLSGYEVTRAGQGPVTASETHMTIRNQAAMFKDRLGTPYWVTYKYDERLLEQPISTTTHAGHEFDIVLKGSMKVRVGDHVETLNEGDSIYYKSSTPHGMIAATPAGVTFLAMVMAGEDGDSHLGLETIRPKTDRTPLVADRYFDILEDERGCLQHIRFRDIEKFNFAFDIVDAIAAKYPDKLAMLHVSDHFTERRFTFREISETSNQIANYFLSLGISRGDKVMLVMKRHFQYWPTIIALHKIGAVVIPAVSQLLVHDFSYRFKAADVKALVCTADGDVAGEAEKAETETGMKLEKFIVNGEREGWRPLDREYTGFSRVFGRRADSPGGNDPMLMFFTSGTTGYPKMALHSYKYALGHYVTAKYWHQVERDGLHFTISETGWAKASWGKLYGQWMCEGALFVYDFARFDAEKILPMFAKYRITTFCAPPTMYRMLIKQDIAKYDFSSVHHATTAGEALNPEVFTQFQKATGLKIYEGFGQTETTCALAVLLGDALKPGSMGKPVPDYGIDLVDEDGNPVPPGEHGEIVVRTPRDNPHPGIFIGYYKDEEKTAEAWRGGVYHTCDLAWKDEDGYYHYVGRADDVIKSSGYRIGPFEIENVIMELPYVVECGVSAAPDPVRGQVVKATIKLVPGKEPSEELKKEVQEYVKHHTAPYKYPRIVVFKDELPKTVSGKIQRNLL
ncbi:MAG: AMP-binding protein [Kiritimatiellae bacterium]|nr:AMP-binding protein [Kiritimatiellia bacterium]